MKRIIFILFVLMLFAAMTVTTTSVQAERGILIKYEGGEPTYPIKRKFALKVERLNNEMVKKYGISIKSVNCIFQPEENPEEMVLLEFITDPASSSFKATSGHKVWHSEATQEQHPYIKAVINAKFKIYMKFG